MKQKFKKFILLSLIPLLSSCTILRLIIGEKDDSIYGSISTSSTSVSNSTNNSTNSSTTSESSTSSSTNNSKYENISPLHQRFLQEDMTVGLPSSGNVKSLVIPVQIGNDSFSTNELEMINLAFNGTSEETGYESVNSYYYKASNGLLNLSADIAPVYQTGKTKLYYESLYMQGEDIEYEIIRNALTLLDDSINYADYDYNNDGYIDSIYLIYSCDYSYDDYSPWWAWCYEYFTEGYEYYDGVEADYYVWASVDFLKDPSYSGVNVNINAETIIHETGHLFGLDDYYDYNENKGNKKGTGGGIMMDNNVGDHDPLSKALLGWTNPTIVTTSGTYTLTPSVDSNECLLIPLRDYNDNIFNEYLLIDFYTPTSLNEFEKGECGLFTINGIRIFHVDARIEKNLGTPQNPDPESYFTIFSFNNSDTKYNILELVEADNNNSVINSNYSKNSDLFTLNKQLTNFTNNSGTTIKFNLKVTSISQNKAEVEITFEDGK